MLCTALAAALHCGGATTTLWAGATPTTRTAGTCVTRAEARAARCGRAGSEPATCTARSCSAFWRRFDEATLRLALSLAASGATCRGRIRFHLRKLLSECRCRHGLGILCELRRRHGPGKFHLCGRSGPFNGRATRSPAPIRWRLGPLDDLESSFWKGSFCFSTLRRWRDLGLCIHRGCALIKDGCPSSRSRGGPSQT